MKSLILKGVVLLLVAAVFASMGYFVGTYRLQSTKRNAYVEMILMQLSTQVDALESIRSKETIQSKAFATIENMMLGNVVMLMSLGPSVKNLADADIANLCDVEAYIAKYGISDKANGQLKAIARDYLNDVAKAAKRRYKPFDVKPLNTPYAAVA